MISIKIKNPLFTYRARLVNIRDFNLKKLSIEKVCAINDEQEHIYYIKYGGDPFYLVINSRVIWIVLAQKWFAQIKNLTR